MKAANVPCEGKTVVKTIGCILRPARSCAKNYRRDRSHDDERSYLRDYRRPYLRAGTGPGPGRAHTGRSACIAVGGIASIDRRADIACLVRGNEDDRRPEHRC